MLSFRFPHTPSSFRATVLATIAWLWILAPAYAEASPPRVDDQYIIQPSVDAHVLMIGQDRALIRWTPPHRRITVHVGNAPDRTDTFLIEIDAKNLSPAGEILAEPVPPFPRPIFRLTFADPDLLPLEFVVSERWIFLEGASNFRDLGGYRTESGRYTRWGKLYRSDSLAHLTSSDRDLLCAIGIRNVIDLRTEKEAAQSADLVPSCMSREHLPVYMDREKPGCILWLLSRSRFERDWRGFYTEFMITQKAVMFGRFLKRLAEPDLSPTVFHCTAGKDRTGIAAMLVLAALGVPEQTILADYSLSNRGFGKLRERIEQQYGWLGRIGVQTDRFTPILLADPQYLMDAFSYIREKYGSMETYLQKEAGVDRETIERLKENFLIKAGASVGTPKKRQSIHPFRMK